MKNLIILLMITYLAPAFSQDASFTNPNPLSISPSNIGLVSEENRLIAWYRLQYHNLKGFNTHSVSYDHRFNIGRSDFLGAGFIAQHDKVGQASLMDNSASLGASYWKQLHANRTYSKGYLILGASTGFGNRKFDKDNLIWSEQFTGTGFDQSLDSGEELHNNRNYFDLSVGLSYFASSEGVWFIKLGGAVHHINQPNISFTNSPSHLPRKITVYASGFHRAQLQGYNYLLLFGSITYQQQSSLKVLIPQFRVGFELKNNQFFDIGIGSRLTNNITGNSVEAITALCKFRINQAVLELNYDITVSSNVGKDAFDMSLIYLFKNKTKRGIYCPPF